MLQCFEDYEFLSSAYPLYKRYVGGDIIPQNDINNRSSPISNTDAVYLLESFLEFTLSGVNETSRYASRLDFEYRSSLFNHAGAVKNVLNDMWNDLSSMCCDINAKNLDYTLIYLTDSIENLDFTINAQYSFLDRETFKTYNCLYGGFNDVLSCSFENMYEPKYHRTIPYGIDHIRRLYWCLFQNPYILIGSSWTAKNSIPMNYRWLLNSVDDSITEYSSSSGITTKQLGIDLSYQLLSPYTIFYVRSIRRTDLGSRVYVDTCIGLLPGLTINVDIDLKSNKIKSAYALVEYRGFRDNGGFSYKTRVKSVPLEHVNGTIWRVEYANYDICKGLVLEMGYDWNNIGRLTTSSSYRYEVAVILDYIAIRYDHMYRLDISELWLWTPFN